MWFLRLMSVPGLCLFFAAQALAQQISLMPYAGFFLPRLNDANQIIDEQLSIWQELLGVELPAVGDLGFNKSYGGQIYFHLRESYHLGIQAGYYSDRISTAFQRPGNAIEEFIYRRETSFVDVNAELRYDFEGPPGRGINPFVKLGIGVLAAKAHAHTKSSFETSLDGTTMLPQVDTRGDFSGTTLSATLALGFIFYFDSPVFLWAESGGQAANVGTMGGTIRRLGASELPDAVSTTSFDFSGLFFRGGIGLALGE